MTGKACVSYFFHYCDKMLDRSNLRKVSFLLSLSLRRSSPMWQESAMTETEMVGPTAPTVRMQRSLSPFYLVWFQPLRWCHVCSECIFLKQTSLKTPSEICPEVCPSDDSKSSHGAPPLFLIIHLHSALAAAIWLNLNQRALLIHANCWIAGGNFYVIGYDNYSLYPANM